jgi:hypothetical protein
MTTSAFAFGGIMSAIANARPNNAAIDFFNMFKASAH